MKMNKNRKGLFLAGLVLFLFAFSFISSFYNSNSISNLTESNPKASLTNTLFNGKSYPFEVKDVYDDENAKKVYTDAYLQTEYFDESIWDFNGTVFSDQVPMVNNTNYKSPDVNGNYPATYSFTSDADGSVPTGWTVSGGSTVSVVSDFQGHNKVMSNLGTGSGWQGVYNNFGSNKLSGVIELWMLTTDVTTQGRVQVEEVGTAGQNLALRTASAGNFQYLDSGGWHTICAWTINTWYHIKVQWYSDNTYDVYLYNNLVVDGVQFYNNMVSGLSRISLIEYNGAFLQYYDAIGYSWDPYYTVGDNLYSEPIIMTNGFFDNTDNMKANDDSYSEFTSEREDPSITPLDTIYGESLGESTTTNVVVEKVSITITPAIAHTTYLLLAMAEIGVDSSSYAVNFRVMTDDATTLTLQQYQPYTDVNDYVNAFLVAYVDVETSMKVDLDFYSSSASATARIRDARLIAIECVAEAYDMDLTRVTHGGDLNYQTMSSITITPDGTEEFIIFSNMVIDEESTSWSVYGQLYDGSTSLQEDRRELMNIANRFPFSAIRRVSISSPTTYYNRYRTAWSSYAAGCSYSHLLAVPSAWFDNFYYNSHTPSSTPSVSNTWEDKVVNTYTPEANYHLIVGSVQYRAQDYTYSASTRMSFNGSVDNEAIKVDKDATDWCSNGMFGYYYLTASSKTDKIQMWMESGGSNADFQEAWLFSIQLSSTKIGNTVLDFTIDMNFNELDLSDLLCMNISSFHFTNISQSIIGSIYDYDTSSYIEMFTSSNTVETMNSFEDTTSLSSYLDGSGNLRLKFNSSGSDNYKLSIDYLKIIFYYKMDLIIYKTFYINGIWRYRFEIHGSLHYTDWTVFEVIDPLPNFEAISESDLTTRWVLQGAEISAVEDFHDDINTNYWNLVDISNKYIRSSILPVQDSALLEKYPDTSYPTAITLYAYTSNFGDVKDGRGLLEVGFDNYLHENSSVSNSSLYAWTIRSDLYTGDYLYLHNTTFFDDETVTWNTQPSTTGLISATLLTTIADSSYNYYDLGSYGTNTYIRISHDETIIPDPYESSGCCIRSMEHSTYKPYFIHYATKNYFGSGYMYMQTNTTELIGLKSIDYGTHKTLSSGDYFEIDYQTNSDSKIELILLKDGVVNKTLTLSPSGNTNFNRHTAQISVSEDVEFDQLKISSTFEDEDNIKVYDIKTMKYTLTGDFADFYVGSKRTKEIYLNPDLYNLRIFEEGLNKVNINITIPSTGIYQYVYTPIENLQCRLTLFNTEGMSLLFTDYHVKINRSLNGEYNEFWLLDPLFYADKDTYTYISVYDRFNTLIDSFSRLASEYIDLELEVYQLQIKNLMTQKTTLDINSSYTYPLLSGDSLYFMLSTAYYQIGYYDTNDIYKQFTIYLDSNQAYELNRSKICFLSYADQQGNHLFFDDYKTYLNNSLIYENIFYREIGDIVGIEIKDRYNISILNDTYTVVSGDNYIPITLTLYSLKVMNQQEQFNHINITRDPNHYESEMYWSEWIAPNEIIEFKLFAGFYKINLTDNENEAYSYYAYTLTGDDILLISSDNIISQVIYNIANVNTTLGNQITNVEINITNQNTAINNTVVSIEINLSNVNSTLGNLLTDIDLSITNLQSDIDTFFTFTNNSFINLNSSMNSSFIYMENNIISINQSISTLVIGIDNQISVLDGTVNTMFTEMNNQFIVTQTTINYSFSFLNQTIIQLANNITDNHVILYNLIEQRANDIDSSLIDIETLINLVNNTVADESLVIQTLVNIIGNNMTNYYTTINNLLNLIDNNITNNNIQLVSILELIGNNITTNQFVLETLLDVIGNNITENHIELLTNLNLINTTIGQNQIELINKLLVINSTINDLFLDLTNQIILVNDTIYSAVLNLSTSVEFGVDVILGNLTLTYQQNEFLTELYKETMFSQLLNWSDVAYNYTLMEDRIDVWEFINNYKNDSITIFLKYNDLTENLTLSAQNSIEQYLPAEDVVYRLYSIEQEEYLTDWEPLPENRTVNFGFFEAEIPLDPKKISAPFYNIIIMIFIFAVFIVAITLLYSRSQNKRKKVPKYIEKSYNFKPKPTTIRKSLIKD